MKSTTINRFREWAKTHEHYDKFSAGTRTWTKQEFAEAFLGEINLLGERPKNVSKQLNIDVEVELDADLERTLETGHTEESGD